MRRALLIPALLAATAYVHADEDQRAREVVTNNCLMCHTDEILAQQRLTQKQWAAVVKKMVGWGAPVEPENVDVLVQYLAARYGTAAPPYQVPTLDIKKANAAFLPEPDGPLRGGDPSKGKQLYATACASCHGADGHGSPTGTNLADRSLLWHAGAFGEIVRTGRGRMPAFVQLGRPQVASILAYLRAL
jgi:mono/diheme cytochrome c family protein